MNRPGRTARVGHWHATAIAGERFMVEYATASGTREFIGTPAIRDGLFNIPAQKLPIHLNASLVHQITKGV